MFSHILYKNYDVRSANYLPCLRHVAHISKFRKVNKMGIFLGGERIQQAKLKKIWSLNTSKKREILTLKFDLEAMILDRRLCTLSQ